MLVLATICAATVALAACSAARQIIGQRAFVRRLEIVAETAVEGRAIAIVRGAECVAFCAGFVRPRIFLSHKAVARLTEQDLRAVVAHEGHHADRRDPLRLLIGRALTSSLRVIPAVGALGGRQAVLAELAADAAAVRSLGGPAPLAAALLAFDGDRGAAAVAPERVDYLLGEAASEGFPPALLAFAKLALAALSVVALLLVALPAHPNFPVLSLPICMAAVAVVASPAWVVTRRLTRALHPIT